MTATVPAAARAVGLIYFPDDRPGIQRRRAGRGFSYIAPDGTRIDDRDERARIAALGVPPAYEDVWICPRPDGHLQATGRDARARKQYRYHPDWSAYRDRVKFDQLAAFGLALPRIRARVRRDLEEEPGERAFARAAVIALMDRLSLRIGHPENVARNGSYGATVLERRHLTFEGETLRLRYRAKGGKMVTRRTRDGTLHRALQKADDLPGKLLLSWTDAAGEVRGVSSEALNAFLSEVSGNDAITAKTFRTWNGTLAAFDAARTSGGGLTIRTMAEAAARALHNTPTIARKSYIHPDVIGLADLADADREARLTALAPAGPTALRVRERELLGFLGAG